MHSPITKDIYDYVECTSICVMPEYSEQNISKFTGICSDYIEKY